MKQLLIKSGKVFLKNVPAPTVSSRNVLVQLHRSCISIGTELAGVRMSGLPLYRRALKQPHHLKKALGMMKEQGVLNVYKQISGKLNAGVPIGYSASGVVIEVGSEVEGISVGDRVACAGAGVANHAEVVSVPVNLCVIIPKSINFDSAATVTLGAIALQGVRRAQLTLGETVLVIGLGILGQITAQLIQANGCRVIGTDVDKFRIATASDNGMHIGLDPGDCDIAERVEMLTDGHGADAVVITAASSSNEVISQAFNACRKKARVVLVGDVGLNMQRSDLYAKELDFLVSTSYGPGRYDPLYEEGGQDYPIAYVRWTENRNMQEYLRLLESKKVNLANMLHAPYEISQAEEAYAMLQADGKKPLLVLLAYPDRGGVSSSTHVIKERPRNKNVIGVAMVGAGSFAQAVHLPNLEKIPGCELRMVVNRSGHSAQSAADRFGAYVASTDFEAALSDESIDLVMIATRHNLHASMVLDALNAGKNVFVEKPLALTRADVTRIEDFYQSRTDAPLLMTGFNRRFSPAMLEAKSLLENRTSPLIFNYSMNAGFIPSDHWVHGEEGGGRNIGEACHIYDLFSFITGARPTSLAAHSIKPLSKYWQRNDNFSTTIRYEDGSVCNLIYTSMGNREYPKEQGEIYSDGMVIALRDYKSLEVFGGRGGWSSRTVQKGQFEEMETLVKALQHGSSWPISLKEQLDVANLSIEIESLIVE